MPRKSPAFTVERANLPDPQAAADAILPMFLAFLEGRLVKRPPVEGREISPARANETSGSLPP